MPDPSDIPQTGLVQPWVQSEGSCLTSATPLNVRIYRCERKESKNAIFPLCKSLIINVSNLSEMTFCARTFIAS